MICGSSSLKREFDFSCRSLFRFLDLYVSAAMACFFDCFRGRDGSLGRRRHPHHLISPARTPAEAGVSKNRLASLFLSEETEDSPATGKGNLAWGSPQTQKELRNEARFLKASGTLPETPAEFRKPSHKLKSSPSANDDSENFNHHSWLPNSSAKKLLADMQTDEHSTPIKSVEELGRPSISSDQAPSSCISYAQNNGRVSTPVDSDVTNMETVSKVHEEETDDASSATPLVAVTNTQLRNKSVHFQCDFDTSSSGTSGDTMKTSDRFGDFSVTKFSTRPTPLKLSSEMQTPGTVFSTNLETLGNGNARVRSQYVCSLLQPVENASQWQDLKEEDNHANSEPLDQQSERSSPSKVEESLSAWLKPVSQTNLDPSKKFHVGKTPGDRPIIGMVAAHWNEDQQQPTEISPKWWDGNGIPNSTNKYKEDQKVSWHATPFEERLEKALSEETLISQKKPVNGSPISFEEGDETDTAFSQLPAATSSHSKSVVSY